MADPATCPICQGRAWERVHDSHTRFRCLGCETICQMTDGHMVQSADTVPLTGSEDHLAREALGPQIITEAEWARNNRAFNDFFRRR